MMMASIGGLYRAAISRILTVSITIRRDGGKDRSARLGAKSRWGWWLALAFLLAGGIVVAAWIKGGPVQMREEAVELSARQVGVNGQVGR
jgi:hypothetical protein